MGCAGTWAAPGSQVGQLSVRRHTLFSRLLLSASPSFLSTLTSALLTLLRWLLLLTAVEELGSLLSLSHFLFSFLHPSSPLFICASSLPLRHPCAVQASGAEAPGRALPLTRP